MPGFSVSGNGPAYQDTGQGAVGRLLSWMAWTADPNPLTAPEQTVILRTDDNGAAIGAPTKPLGQGGVGRWEPILGDSTGATSGGSSAFFTNV